MDDVRPYQAMKLRLLNGTHSAIAYAGQLRGLETVSDAMRDPLVGRFARRLMLEDLRATVAAPAGYDVLAYCDELLRRFENPSLAHRTQQIAMDGTQKVPVRWLPALRESVAAGVERPMLERALAAWLHYLARTQRQRSAARSATPAPRRSARACAHGQRSERRVHAALAQHERLRRRAVARCFIARLARHLAAAQGGMAALLSLASPVNALRAITQRTQQETYMNITRRQFGATLAATAWPRPRPRDSSSRRAEIKLKYGTAFPADHPGTVRIKEAAEAIRKDTGGKVDLQVYPTSQLGSEPDMISQTRAGAIDFMSTAGTNLQTLVPTAGINGVAFAFKDYHDVWAAMDGDLGAHVRRAIDKVNLHAFDKCSTTATATSRRPPSRSTPRTTSRASRSACRAFRSGSRCSSRSARRRPRSRSASSTRRCRPRSSTARRTRWR